MANRQETGKDGTLIVSGREVPFTSADYSIDFDTTSSDFNDGLEQDTAYVSKHAEGSIEAEGSKAELKSLLINDDGSPVENIRIQVRGDEGGDRFTGVRINSFGREYPGGDKTTTTIDFEADRHRPL